MKIKKTKVYSTHGPSLTVPYKAVIVEYENFETHDDFTVSAQEKDAIRTLLPENVTSKLNFDEIKNIDSLLTEIMRAFININFDMDLKIELKTTNKNNDKNHKLLCLEYLYQAQLIPPINAAFGIAAHIKSGVTIPQQQTNTFINQVIKNNMRLSPMFTLKNILQNAKRLDIPYYPIDAPGGVFSYGQGKNSIFFDFAGPQFDSQIGLKLQSDKTKTNMYLKLLGFPTTEQRTANSIKECHEAAEQLGFPLVIKPLAGVKGIGVTANIHHNEQIAEAYKVAAKNSNSRVIVEKFVEGNTHRMTVSNGTVVKGISCLYPPFVIGDGENSILKLIEIENKRRDTPDENEVTTRKIILDETMMKNLQDIEMDEHSILEKSSRINLRHTSNAFTGGKVILVDKKHAHPDNLKMVLDITRLFKLDCSGIDYITPDISRSWREMGAVIEVNSQPGVGPALAEGILQSHFADKNNGKIDSTLVVTNNDKFAQKIVKTRKTDGLKIGFANAEKATLDDEVRRTAQDDLYDNCRSLLIHPDCDAIIVSMTSERIFKDGLPIDYFDKLIVDPACSDDAAINEVKDFLRNHVGQFINGD